METEVQPVPQITGTFSTDQSPVPSAKPWKNLRDEEFAAIAKAIQDASGRPIRDDDLPLTRHQVYTAVLLKLVEESTLRNGEQIQIGSFNITLAVIENYVTTQNQAQPQESECPPGEKLSLAMSNSESAIAELPLVATASPGASRPKTPVAKSNSLRPATPKAAPFEEESGSGASGKKTVPAKLKGIPKCFMARSDDSLGKKEGSIGTHLKLFIEKETERIELACHAMACINVAQWLVDAAKKGVTVQVITNDWSTSKTLTNQWNGIKTLLKGGVSVRCNRKVVGAGDAETLRHNFIVFGEQKMIWTGSYSFSSEDSGHCGWEDAIVIPGTTCGGVPILAFQKYRNQFSHVWDSCSDALKLVKGKLIKT